MTGDNYVSSLVGYNLGTIIDCYATVDVETTGNVITYAGGLVGYNDGSTIKACYATGTVTAGAANRAGGLVGYSDGTITACYARGNPTGNFNIGGLVGNNTGPITACYAIGNATATSGTGRRPRGEKQWHNYSQLL